MHHACMYRRGLPGTSQASQRQSLEGNVSELATNVSNSHSLSTTTDSSDRETESDCSERDPSRGPKYASVLHEPYQPHMSSLPGKVFPKRKIGSRNRRFQQGRYDQFSWLEYSQQEIQPISMCVGLPIPPIRLAVLIQHSLTVVFETGSQPWKIFEVTNNQGCTNLLLSCWQMHV